MKPTSQTKFYTEREHAAQMAIQAQARQRFQRQHRDPSNLEYYIGLGMAGLVVSGTAFGLIEIVKAIVLR